MGDEFGWIFETVAQIFKSPAWEADVYGFIDEFCIVFDNVSFLGRGGGGRGETTIWMLRRCVLWGWST